MWKRFIKAAPWLIAFTFLFLLLCNLFINNFSKTLLYNNTAQIPSNEYGMILGTSKYVRTGIENNYFNYRIQAAVELFNQQKIKKIIVSGDNREANYNEPAVMRKALLKAQIPDSVIIIENDGYRTFNSIHNLKDSLYINRVTIITQRFHNQRAVYLAHRYGINAIGFCANDIGFYKGFKIHFREFFAKAEAVMESFL